MRFLTLLAILCSSAQAGEILRDYAAAKSAAKASKTMLMVSCEPTTNESVADYFAKSAVLKPLTLCRVTGADATNLARDPSLSEMHGAGVFMVDPEGQIVSILPFRRGKYYQFHPAHLDVLAGLPAGTLTQRSMIFAVRIHPENPRSTDSRCDAMLSREAEGHSAHQARICLQGHHGWEQRYHRIVGKMGGTATEVCAESWEDEDLIDACVDCTLSWRQSSGHWRGVVNPNDAYGYDIRRGRNGIWYGTGIFQYRR